MDLVYHFTDTARLPWILRSGELRPSSNRIGGLPDDFLWATTDSAGDPTASAMAQAGSYKRGCTRLVRFKLHADDFEPWREVVGRFPAWKPNHVARLEQVAKSSPTLWRCRTTPLPRFRWVGIDTRSYQDKTWRPFEGDVLKSEHDEYIGVEIAGRCFFSRQEVGGGRGGATRYQIRTRGR